MVTTNMNAFDLLGNDETDDVTILYECMKNKITVDEQVPTSTPRSKNEVIVYGEELVRLKYEDEDVYVNEDTESKNGYVKKGISNGDEQRGNRTYSRNYGNGGKPRNRNNNHGERRGNGGYHGQGRNVVEYRRIDKHDNNDTKESGNGGGVDVSITNANSEGDACVIIEPSNGKEIEEKKSTEDGVAVEDVNVDVPKPEETLEELKKRKEEQEKKELEERRRKREEERAEEAKMMTLAEYEKRLLEKKKQALDIQKTETRRVVVVDKDLENMKVVSKKQEDDAWLIVETEKPKDKATLEKQTLKTSKEKLEKSDSSDKGRKPVAERLAQLFRPASFRGSNNVGRGQAIDRGQTSNDGAQCNDGAAACVTCPPKPEKIPSVDEDFPVLGSLAPEPKPKSSEPPANPSAPSGSNRSSYGSSRSAPFRSRNNGSRGNDFGSGRANRANGSYYRDSGHSANRSAPADKSSGKAEH